MVTPNSNYILMVMQVVWQLIFMQWWNTFQLTFYLCNILYTDDAHIAVHIMIAYDIRFRYCLAEKVASTDICCHVIAKIYVGGSLPPPLKQIKSYHLKLLQWPNQIISDINTIEKRWFELIQIKIDSDSAHHCLKTIQIIFILEIVFVNSVW